MPNCVCLTSVVFILGALHCGEDEPPQAEPQVGLAVGQQAPFFVVDFYHGTGHAGCPAVMIAGRKAQGVLIFFRGDGGEVGQLARDLEAEVVDGQRTLGFLIQIGGDKDSVQKQAAGLNRTIAGVPRGQSVRRLAEFGLDENATAEVYFLRGKSVLAAQRLKPGELTAAKRKELVALLKALAAKSAESPPAR